MNKQDLIKKIKDLKDITSQEKAYLIELVNTKKKYGLVWEDKPEDVEKQLRSMLPVFKEVKDRAIISKNPDAPNHILIEGDNLHALTALSYTHEGKIDVIYIDPPYNTGKENEFKYNDKWVEKTDTYKHSKWLSFLNKRLKLSKKLLRDDGVILISIDDYENAQLRLLCNEIYGEKNFIGALIWNKQHSQQQGIISKYHEYVYVYAKDISQIKNIRGGEGDIVAGAMKKISAKNPASEFTFPAGVRFDAIDGFEIKGSYGESEKMTITSGTLIAENNFTKEAVTISAGWTQKNQMKSFFAGLDTLDTKGQKIKEFYFTSTGKLKSIKERGALTPPSILPEFGMVSEQTDYLNNIFSGENRFSNPKPVEMITLFINWFTSNKNEAIILDFFAGSGTTLDSIIRINNDTSEKKLTGIIVTNNEITPSDRSKLLKMGVSEEELYNYGLCHYVTYPRIHNLLKGYYNAKKVKIDALEYNNLRYFQAEFVPSERTELNRRLLTARSTDILCIKEDCFISKTKDWKINERQAQIFTNGLGKYMVVVYHSRITDSVIAELTKKIETLETTEKVKVYAFNPTKDSIEDDFFKVADKIVAVPLPDSIYNAYLATFRSLKLNQDTL